MDWGAVIVPFMLPKQTGQDRRTGKRRKVNLPVKLWGLSSEWGKPFTEEATTIDVSVKGAQLRGVRQSLSVGDVVAVEYDTRKACFEVVWVGKKGLPTEGHIGLRSLEPQKFIWGEVPLPRTTKDLQPHATEPVAMVAEELTAPAMSPLLPPAPRDRRRHVRYSCTGKLEILSEKAEVLRAGKLRDISSNGCFLEIAPPPSMATRIQMSLWVGGLEVRVQGVVRFVVGGRGVGIEFLEVDRDDRSRLEEIISILASGRSPSPEVDSQQSPAASPSAAVTAEKLAQPKVDVNVKVESVRRWSNRRRTERVLLRFPVVVSGKTKLGRPFSENAESLVVTFHGGLIAMRMLVEPGQILVLSRKNRPEEVNCKVVYVGKITDGKTEVGVEFDNPNRTFWGITFAEVATERPSGVKK